MHIGLNHRNIKNVFEEQLVHKCIDIESGKIVKLEKLQGLVEFMRVISGSEERIISLKNEHEEGRQYVSRKKVISEKEEHKKLSTMAEN